MNIFLKHYLTAIIILVLLLSAEIINLTVFSTLSSFLFFIMLIEKNPVTENGKWQKKPLVTITFLILSILLIFGTSHIIQTLVSGV